MRDLLTKVDPSLWSQVSVILFTFSFLALIFYVFWPSRKTIYEQKGKLPLEN